MESVRGKIAVRSNYKLKFSLALLTIFLLTGVAGGYIYLTVDEQITNETQHQLVSTAEGESVELDNWLELTDQQLVSSARTTAVRSGETFRIADLLTRISERNSITETHLVDSETGDVLVDTGGEQTITTGQTLVGDALARVRQTTGDSTTGVQFSRPFTAADGAPLLLATKQTESRDGRALVAVVDLRQLSERLISAGYERSENQTINVLGRGGTTLLSSNESAILTEDPTWDEATYNGSGYGTYDAGSELAVGHASLDRQPWVVTDQVETDEAYALRSSVANRILLLLAVLLVGLGTFGLTIGRDTVRTVRALVSEAETLRSGTLDTPIETARDDEFGDIFRALEQLRDSLGKKIEEVETEFERAEAARQSAEAARTEAEQAHSETKALNEHLEEKATSFSATMARAAEGDLTERMETESENEAMAEIATSFNEMMAELETTFGQIQSFADEVVAASEEMHRSSQESQNAGTRVAQSVQAISADADSQSRSLATAADEVQELSADIEQASDLAADATAISEQTAQRGRHGKTAASAAIAEMTSIEAKSNETVGEIERLDAKVDEIQAISGLISDIAAQTNTLALNASIEAARAGEDGDGFAVVAEEIKTLADETAAATDQIQQLVDDVQDTTHRAVADMQAMNEQVVTGTTTVEEALAALEDIAENAQQVNEHMQDIDATMDRQATSANAVAETIGDVATAAETVSAESDTVSGAAQEQTATLADAVQRAETLSQTATQLQTELETFTIDGDTASVFQADSTETATSSALDD